MCRSQKSQKWLNIPVFWGFKPQGRSRSLTLVPAWSSSAVFVMIFNMTVPICKFLTLGSIPFDVVREASSSMKFCRKMLEFLRRPLVYISWLYDLLLCTVLIKLQRVTDRHLYRRTDGLLDGKKKHLAWLPRVKQKLYHGKHFERREKK